MDKKYRIVIDARMYGLEHAGIGRYIINLLNQIEKIDHNNYYFILLRKKYYQSLTFKNKRFRKILSEYHHYTFKEQLLLPLQLIKLKPNLVHFPHFNTPILWWGKQVVTIHDLIKHESKGCQTTTRNVALYWFKFYLYRLMVWFSVKKAVKIIVPSQFWKEDLQRRYRLQPGKVTVTYEGVDEKFLQQKVSNNQSKRIKAVLSKYNITEPFFIYTGSLYPHKNIERLVRAIQCVHVSIHEYKNPTLVVVCARSIFYDRFKQKVKELGAEESVNMIGFVSDDELRLLYQAAEAFVFPTLMEGFGLPGLEAMAVGCSVLASDILILREIYGKAVLYFNPLDEGDIAEKLKRILANQELKNKLKMLGFTQVKKYSWQKMARETLRLYQSIFPDVST